ncbi:putative short-chain dehydrogenase/reductase family 42E member 2 [Sphaerodactylus townsendi]|uniref:putative short-chain dehydrogenase/reductase family 42E member 2 n=1 Tax=Sphaerodactylus townsendi TaxID=933632 RepID=UPI002025C22C|nr:putative short-chain dehydrogenase/reductase family 42E member 2 [Sphaerodactylus townsendi]
MESPPAQEKKPLKPLKRDAKQAEQKTDASKPKIVSLKTVITGGAGHFGFTLGCTLAKAGTDVVIYDIQKPLWPIPKGVALVQGDVRHYTDFYAACEGADCVVHAAAYGMSGVEQLHRREIQSVNVRGTGIVIEVCRKRNIPRLIYTSTVNVVFAGQTIIDGDEESVPYYPLDKHVNEYSRTKSIAEQMVLAANGSSLAGGGKLYTCALRAPGIYGPEEQRHMPRMALNIERGLFNFKVGSPNTFMNWAHVKNLVQAHVLAAEALTPEKNYIAGGQAYFINDGEKVNLYEWLSPLFEALGARKPWIHSPVFLVHLSAVFMEYLYLLLRPLVEINPLVTRYEVHNISCMHTFKIDKARKQLGYAPKKYTFASCVDHFMKTRPRRRNFFLLKLFFCLLLFVGMIVLCVKYRETGDFLRERWARYQELLQ